jgi:beta-glucosidase
VKDLLSRMTLDEKVAQTLAVWQQKRMLVDASGNFDPSKAAAVLKDGIGQITRVSDGIEHGRRLSPRETVEFANAIQKWVIEHTRLGIPAMFHEEALHGLAATKGTNFPCQSGSPAPGTLRSSRRCSPSRRARRARVARSRCCRR